MQVQTNSIALPANHLSDKNNFIVKTDQFSNTNIINNNHNHNSINGNAGNNTCNNSNKPFFVSNKSIINNEIQESVHSANGMQNMRGLDEADYLKNMTLVNSSDKTSSRVEMGPNLLFNHKKCGQRKNTSDSNVKLLADHNFYHVANKRILNEYQHKDNGLIYKEIPEYSSKSNLHCNNDLIKPIEINDYLKYGMKFKRGCNSSSNSLMSLNSSRLEFINV